MDVKINSELVGNPIEYRGFKVRFEPWVIEPEFGVKLEAKVDSTLNLLGNLESLGSTHFFQSVQDMIEFWSENLSDDDLWRLLTKSPKVKGRTYVEWVEHSQDMKEQTGCNGYARVVGLQLNGEPEIEEIPCTEGLDDAKDTILRMVNTVIEFKLKSHVRATELVAYRRLAFDPNKKHELMVVPSKYPEDKVVGLIALHKYDVKAECNWKGVAGIELRQDLERYNKTLNKYWTWRYVVIPPDCLPSYRHEVIKNMMPLTDEQLEQEMPNIFKTIDEMIEKNKKYFNQPN